MTRTVASFGTVPATPRSGSTALRAGRAETTAQPASVAWREKGQFVNTRSARMRGGIYFRTLEPPSRHMHERVIRRVRDRSLCWLRCKGLLDKQPAEVRSNEPRERSAIDARADIALQGDGFAALDHHVAAADDDRQGRFDPKRLGYSRRRSTASTCKRLCASHSKWRSAVVSKAPLRNDGDR
jgi:hypothetical protein